MTNRKRITNAVEACGWKIKNLDFERESPDVGSWWSITIEAGKTSGLDGGKEWSYTPMVEYLDDFFNELRCDYLEASTEEATNDN